MSDADKAKVALLLRIGKRSAEITAKCVRAASLIKSNGDIDPILDEILALFDQSKTDASAVRNIIKDRRSSSVKQNQRAAARKGSRVMIKKASDLSKDGWGWTDDDLRNHPPIGGRKDLELPLDHQDPKDVIDAMKGKK